eukprot:281185_1
MTLLGHVMVLMCFEMFTVSSSFPDYFRLDYARPSNVNDGIKGLYYRQNGTNGTESQPIVYNNSDGALLMVAHSDTSTFKWYFRGQDLEFNYTGQVNSLDMIQVQTSTHFLLFADQSIPSYYYEVDDRETIWRKERLLAKQHHWILQKMKEGNVNTSNMSSIWKYNQTNTMERLNNLPPAYVYEDQLFIRSEDESLPKSLRTWIQKSMSKHVFRTDFYSNERQDRFIFLIPDRLEKGDPGYNCNETKGIYDSKWIYTGGEWVDAMFNGMHLGVIKYYKYSQSYDFEFVGQSDWFHAKWPTERGLMTDVELTIAWLHDNRNILFATNSTLQMVTRLKSKDPKEKLSSLKTSVVLMSKDIDDCNAKITELETRLQYYTLVGILLMIVILVCTAAMLVHLCHRRRDTETNQTTGESEGKGSQAVKQRDDPYNISPVLKPTQPVKNARTSKVGEWRKSTKMTLKNGPSENEQKTSTRKLKVGEWKSTKMTMRESQKDDEFGLQQANRGKSKEWKSLNMTLKNKPSGISQKSQWTCSVCTFSNQPQSTRCAMCKQPNHI